MLEELGVPCQQLDVFITHDHPDHSGLVPDLAARGADRIILGYLDKCSIMPPLLKVMLMLPNK